MNRRIALAVSVGVLLTGAAPAAAQLRSNDPGVLGLAGSATATVRGAGSVGVNPAGLGMPGSGGWRVTLPGVRVDQILSPISLSDVNEFAGKPLTAAVKDRWLTDIRAAGGQSGTVGGTLSGGGLTLGSLSLQYQSQISVGSELNGDAAELLLYGNAGRTGSPQDFDFGGSSLDVAATSALSVSYGLPLGVSLTGASDEAFALGVTAKYLIGHFLVLARDQGSAISSDPLEIGVQFPVIQSDTDNFEANGGSGVGLDLGASWSGGAWSAGVTVHNLLNTFSWDEAKLRVRPGTALFDGDASESDFDLRPFSQAPVAMRNAVGDMGFGPSVAVGLGYTMSEALTLSADYRGRFGDGTIYEGPDMQVGVGAEFRALPALPIRAGVAYLTDGIQFGGGVELNLGPAQLSLAGVIQSGDAAGRLLQVGLSFGGGN